MNWDYTSIVHESSTLKIISDINDSSVIEKADGRVMKLN